MPKTTFITTIVNSEVEEQRDQRLSDMETKARGKRCQPPMVDRLRTVTILTDWLEANGMRFATARSSQMNNSVREWLNERTQRSSDPRKSRQKQLGPDAVRELLKQVSKHR